jgi:protein TonB
MQNEKRIKFLIPVVVAALHAAAILFLAFEYKAVLREAAENARIMKLADLAEEPPPPPIDEIPKVEAIAETMIETDFVPQQTIVAAGSLITGDTDYLPMHLVSQLPVFSEDELRRRVVYPPIAQRSELEATVYLEIFVDREGMVRNVTILREDPSGWGFGEAAVKAFQGFKGRPALENGREVAVRYRYPVRFSLRYLKNNSD